MTDALDPVKLARARRSAQKQGLAAVQRHLLLCIDTAEASCAPKKQMRASWKHLKKRCKERKLAKLGVARRSGCTCFGLCKAGPVAVVYPDHVWYGHCTPDNLDRIIDEHLLHGRVVEDLLIDAPPGWQAPEPAKELVESAVG